MTAAAPPHAASLTEVMFHEELAKVEPALPAAVKAFLELVEPLGVHADLKSSLNLKVEIGDGTRPVDPGYIVRNDQLWTNPLAGSILGRLAWSYNNRLAALIGGSAVETSTGCYLTTNGKSAPRISALPPVHATGWAAAIRDLLDDLARHLRETAA